jgi:hypothetical protein
LKPIAAKSISNRKSGAGLQSASHCRGSDFIAGVAIPRGPPNRISIFTRPDLKNRDARSVVFQTTAAGESFSRKIQVLRNTSQAMKLDQGSLH